MIGREIAEASLITKKIAEAACEGKTTFSCRRIDMGFHLRWLAKCGFSVRYIYISDYDSTAMVLW